MIPRRTKYIIDHENNKLIIIYTHQDGQKETVEEDISSYEITSNIFEGFSYLM